MDAVAQTVGVANSFAPGLETARDSETPVMVFVGNRGGIRNLREGAIARAAIVHVYVVRKPTRDGDVTSLELFDPNGFCFTQLFGARKPGNPELAAWRTVVSTPGGIR